MNDARLADEEFLKEATEIVDRAQEVNFPLRIMGACAIRLHCQDSVELHKVKMKRSITDLDFVTLSRHGGDVRKILVGRGYAPQVATVGLDRDIYRDGQKGITTDVFFDKLSMCHTIVLTGRLELDFPTISLADLLLEKLQIVKITEKDMKDVIALILDHEFGKTKSETIDIEYLAKLLSEDWGFYHTVTTNLGKIKDTALGQYGNLLSEEDLQKIPSRIGRLLSRIEEEPKSMKWRMRQKVGTKKIWYNQIDEHERGTLAEYLMKRNEMKNN